MRRPNLLLLAATLFIPLGGCMSLTAEGTYPVVDDTPNPTPVRGYKVQCTSYPFSVSFFFENTTTNCRSVIPTEDETVVVRARG